MCGRQVTFGLDWFIMQASLQTYESYHNGRFYLCWTGLIVVRGHCQVLEVWECQWSRSSNAMWNRFQL